MYLCGRKYTRTCTGLEQKLGRLYAKVITVFLSGYGIGRLGFTKCCSVCSINIVLL